jgi:hypothetical protein
VEVGALVARRPRSPDGHDRTGADRQLRVVLVIVAPPDDEHFVLQAVGVRLRCPTLTLPVGDLTGDTFADLVERSAARALGLRLTFVALLSAEEEAGTHELVTLCVLREALRRSELDRLDLHLVAVQELGRSDHRIDRLDQLRTAAHWRLVDRTANRLVTQVERAFDTSQALLARNVSEEDGHRGWSQYLDVSSVGAMSTAQGLLALVHAGSGGEIVDEAAATLEAIQNPDGGWQVRRALVGRPSQKSITESTCFCLWALHRAGASATSTTMQNGTRWLEESQQDDGGWQSSAGGESNTTATAAAVRVLSLLGKPGAVGRAIQWLRNAQLDDGGWAATALTADPGQSGAPAYTAHAVLALRWAGVPPEDHSVRRGCDYLRSTFDAAADEPWPSTAVNSVVDQSTAARLEFKHFATPWALAALTMSGRDIGEPTIFMATVKLLKLQQPNGAWRCLQTAPGTHAMWAVHDSLFALRTVLTASTRDLAPAALAEQRHVERSVMQDLVRRLLGGSPAAEVARSAGRTWPAWAWMSALTATAALLLASQVGLLGGLLSSSPGQRLVATGLTVLIATVAAIAPPLLVEEYRIWRRRRH